MDDSANLSIGSLVSDEDISENDSVQGDTWIEELECALLADCDQATLRKVSEGRRIPSALRPDYWRALLALNDAGKVKLNREYDLDNQLEIRQDCEKLVQDIEENFPDTLLTDADKLRLISDFESTLTTYVKARPELNYVHGNGWTDILRVLHNLELSDTQLYQMFFRIVDQYIPKDLFFKPPPSTNAQSSMNSNNPVKELKPKEEGDTKSSLSANQQPVESSSKTIDDSTETKKSSEVSSMIRNPSAARLVDPDQYRKDMERRSIQAYHMLRLLIQYHDPELCSILDSKKIMPNLYVRDWFCSLFARSCSAKLALIIWDTHFKMADPFLIFFAAIVMVVNASDELKKSNMGKDEMLCVLKSMPGKLQEDDIEDLYYLVSNHYTNSTPRSIRSYSHLFFMDTNGNTYSGNDSPDDGQPLLDLKTIQLTNSLDLSNYLCLPIVPAEIFAIDTAQIRSSPTQSSSALKYFLVDCRPAEQYNAGHLTRAFHLDCSLMLREPSSFKTAVQALLVIQRQVVASKSNTGGQHLCFIGSGPSNDEEEDQYVNMVVASFLQKYQKYVSIVVGGFDAIHDYVSTKSELKDSFSKYIVDHNPDLCKACHSKLPGGLANFMAKTGNVKAPVSSSNSYPSTASLFASTTNFFKSDKGPAGTFSRLTSNPQAAATANTIVQSSASMFDKFATAFVSKSGVIKDRLVETLNTTSLATPGLVSGSSSRSHVSSQDKLGRRYTGSNLKYAIDDNDVDELRNGNIGTSTQHDGRETMSEPVQEIQINAWQKQTKIIAFYKCSQIKGNTKYPGFIALTKTHLWILREIPHNKGFASIAAKRPLDMVVQITSKRRQPDLIIFRYGYAQSLNSNHQQASGQIKDLDAPAQSGDSGAKGVKGLPEVIASDHLHIPQAFEMIRLIKREIVRIMDENSRGLNETNKTLSAPKEQQPEVKQPQPIKVPPAPVEEIPSSSTTTTTTTVAPPTSTTTTKSTTTTTAAAPAAVSKITPLVDIYDDEDDNNTTNKVQNES